jgi:hypothetical protein
MMEALNEHNILGKLDGDISLVDIARARLLAALPTDRFLRANPVYYKPFIYRNEGHKYKAYVFRLPLTAGKGFGLAAVGGFELRGKRQGWTRGTSVLFNWEEVSLLNAERAAQIMLGSGGEKTSLSQGGG